MVEKYRFPSFPNVLVGHSFADAVGCWVFLIFFFLPSSLWKVLEPQSLRNDLGSAAYHFLYAGLIAIGTGTWLTIPFCLEHMG